MKTVSGGACTRVTKKVRTKHLTVRLGQVSLRALEPRKSSPKPFMCRNALDWGTSPEEQPSALPLSSSDSDIVADVSSDVAENDCILSQDFFCTPDYITPDGQHNSNNFSDKESTPCPKSPDKLGTLKVKRLRQDGTFTNLSSSFRAFHEKVDEPKKCRTGGNDVQEKMELQGGRQLRNRHVSKSAVALRCLVTPPPCLRNPYLTNTSGIDSDPLFNRKSRTSGFLTNVIRESALSRYRTDFHEIEKIGSGNFSCVFKALKRIDGCMYAIKQSKRPLLQESERTKALMEVQAMAALGFHANIVGYFSSWFESQRLYIQMELCDSSLSTRRSLHSFTEAKILRLLHQIATALQFIHEKGMAHLDIKPDNIYTKKEIYKLGDFGCVTLLDGSLPIEEGDARYMPLEILNENYDHLERVDIFSLGVTIYELLKGSPLSQSGPLREGRLPLLPNYSLHFQHLLKSMVDPDPLRRPSAQQILLSQVFRSHPKQW